MKVPELDLADEMREHKVDPFPDSVVKGEYYGEVCAVMIGADIYGWASRVDALSPRVGALSPVERTRLRQAADALARSLTSFPVEARPYYERVLRIAHLALERA